MSRERRLLLAARRLVGRGPDASDAAARFVPLAGIAVGVAAAGIFWLAAQLWPTSIAVMLAMLVTVVLTTRAGVAPGATSLLRVFSVIIKYNALMALSSAKLPFGVPEHLTLGLIMVAGEAASRALAALGLATAVPASLRISSANLGTALIVGALPALLLGVPGLFGLAGALFTRLIAGAAMSAPPAQELADRVEGTRQFSEICFYLAALASWRYV